VDVLALSEKKTTAQIDLVAMQSKVIVAECMLEKTNHKLFKKIGVSWNLILWTISCFCDI